jgi:hypothetical protein|tara:strand:+ start:592 stop:696 length:105 start_codon:yes stop_codon:yes gene_type:complete
MASSFEFEVSDLLREGINKIEITVAPLVIHKVDV